MLTHAAWLARFNGTPDIVGTVVQFNGSPFTVIGVTAEGYDGMRQYLLPVSGFLPLTSALSLDSRGTASMEERDQSSYRVAAMLKPGVTLAKARAGLAVLADQIKRDHPELPADLQFRASMETRGPAGYRDRRGGPMGGRRLPAADWPRAADRVHQRGRVAARPRLGAPG